MVHFNPFNLWTLASSDDKRVDAVRQTQAYDGNGERPAGPIGDPSRFASAPDFMAYLGLVPSEHSSGPKRRTGPVTKAGDVHARTVLVEAAHSYRFPARITRRKLTAVEAVPETVRAIAWKAQTRFASATVP